MCFLCLKVLLTIFLCLLLKVFVTVRITFIGYQKQNHTLFLNLIVYLFIIFFFCRTSPLIGKTSSVLLPFLSSTPPLVLSRKTMPVMLQLLSWLVLHQKQRYGSFLVFNFSFLFFFFPFSPDNNIRIRHFIAYILAKISILMSRI